MEKRSILERMRSIEEMELALTVFNAERALAGEDKHLEVMRMGDCTLLLEAGSPDNPYYNRVKGFGRKDLARLEEILAVYRGKGISPCFDMTPDHMDEEVAGELLRHGYAPVEQLAFLEGVPGQGEKRRESRDGEKEDRGKSPRIRIEEVLEETAEGFVRIVMASGGMEVGDEVVHRKKHHFHQPHFRNLVAHLGEEVAGIASMFLHGGAGYLANDYTFEAFRGRGVQKALIAYRMAEAEKLGLGRLYTDVVFGSASHENMEACGFRTVFLSTLYSVVRT